MTRAVRFLILLLGFIGLASYAQTPSLRLEGGIRANDLAEVSRALHAGADANVRTSGGTPMLILATHFSDVAIVKSLLEHGAQVTAFDKRALTALHAASHWGRTNIMELYLDRGANPNAADQAGATPMHSAVFGAQYEAIDLLAKRGANINAQPAHYGTPLMMAIRLNIRNDRLPTVVALLRNGANPNSVDMQGDSALHLSLRGNPAALSVPAITTLLDFKASATLANRKGETPAQIAAATGIPEIAALFSAQRPARTKGIQVQYPIGASLAPGERKRYNIYVPYKAQEGGLNIRVKLAGDAADKVRLDTEALVATTLPGWYWVRIPEGGRELSFYLIAAKDADPAKSPIAITTAIVDADGQPSHATRLQMLVEIKSNDGSQKKP